MSVVLDELRKVWERKAFLFIFVFAILLNGALIIANEYKTDSLTPHPRAVKSIYKSLQNLSQKEAYEELNSRYQELIFYQNLEFGINHTNNNFNELDIISMTEKYKTGQYLIYCNNLYQEVLLYRRILTELEKCINYSTYLKGIEEKADNLIHITMFSKPNSFSYKNIIKTREDFSHLKGNNLVNDISDGIRVATDFNATDLLGVFLIFIVCIFIITKEKEEHSLSLLKTTFRGRKYLATSKLIAIFISSFLILISLYTINYILACRIYGFGNASRLIQSIEGYMTSNLSLTVVEYLIYYIVVKLSVYLLVAAILYFICIISKSTISVFILSVLLFGLNWFLNITIQYSSNLAILKYVNLISFLNTKLLFSEYINVNIMNFPVNYIPLFTYVVITLLIVISLIAIREFGNQKLDKKNTSFINYFKILIRKLPTYRGYQHTSILLHEGYKIFIAEKIIILFLLFFLFLSFTYGKQNERLSSMDDLYYKQYMKELEGEITQQKEEFIKEEQVRFDELTIQLEHELNNENNIFILNSYQKELAPYRAFQMVKQQYEYLKTTPNGHFLYDTGYKQLTAWNSNHKDYYTALLIMIFYIASLSGIFSMDFQIGMNKIMNPSEFGRTKVKKSKFLIAIGMMLFIFCITYGLEYYNVFSVYGMQGMNYPALSMLHLSNVPKNISILQYFIHITLLRVFGFFISGILIFSLSVYMKSKIYVYMCSVGILVLPMILSMLGLPIFDYILLNPFLAGNVFFKYYEFAFIERYRLFYSIVTIITSLVVGIRGIVLVKRSY